MFGDAKLDMNCPNCEKEFKVKYKQLSKPGNKIKCPHCRENITITQDNKTKRELDGANKALKDLDKTFKNFDK